jgi:hypothetical protein
MRSVRARFWIETGLGAVTAFLAILTLISKDWIEAVFHVDPDAGSGSLEWSIVAVCAALTVTFAVLAGREWRRAQPAAA